MVVPSAQHFTLVRDLQPGTQYVLSVTAENAMGKSEPSRTVTFTTNEEEPEAPPLDVNAITQGPTTVLVSWKAPQKDAWNGDIEGYYVGFKPKESNGSTSYMKVIKCVQMKTSIIWLLSKADGRIMYLRKKLSITSILGGSDKQRYTRVHPSRSD